MLELYRAFVLKAEKEVDRHGIVAQINHSCQISVVIRRLWIQVIYSSLQLFWCQRARIGLLRILYWLPYKNAACCCTSWRFNVSKFSVVTGLTTLWPTIRSVNSWTAEKFVPSLWMNIIHRRSEFQLLRLNIYVYPLNHPISIVM